MGLSRTLFSAFLLLPLNVVSDAFGAQDGDFGGSSAGTAGITVKVEPSLRTHFAALSPNPLKIEANGTTFKIERALVGKDGSITLSPASFGSKLSLSGASLSTTFIIVAE